MRRVCMYIYACVHVCLRVCLCVTRVCLLACVYSRVCVRAHSFAIVILDYTKRYSLQHTRAVVAIRRFISALPWCCVEAPILFVWTWFDFRLCHLDILRISCNLHTKRTLHRTCYRRYLYSLLCLPIDTCEVDLKQTRRFSRIIQLERNK